MNDLISQVRENIRKYRFSTSDEKELQSQMYDTFLKDLGFEREYYLDRNNIVDFFHKGTGLAIEVKIKGSSPSIHRQIKRYAQFSEVLGICLATAKATGWPKEINGKPSYYIALGESWL